MLHPITQHLLMIESDNDTYPLKDKLQIQDMMKKADEADAKEDKDVKMEADAEDVAASMPESQFGVPRPGAGRWAACLRILDVVQSKTVDIIELDNNETAVSMCLCPFQNRQGELFLCVGTAQDLVFEPRRTCTSGFIHVYRLLENCTKFQLLHKTPIQEIPGALAAYHGRLLVGAGKALRIFELGKRKLLRKCENKKFHNFITSLWITEEDKIIVGDIQHSYQFVKYNRGDNTLDVFADDYIPRWLTSGTMTDPTTIASGDKFGSFFTLRLPDKINKLIEEDPAGGSIIWQTRDIPGAPYKLDMLNSFYVGETITKVVKTTITPGGQEIILYSTIFGTIGAFLPFSSREDIDFFSNLEIHMRTENRPLCGRDHLSFRSYYAPVKSVVDGDLCEQFPVIPYDTQKKIADVLERNPGEVQKKLEDMRNTI